jgi:L-ascorbate metabolism protein UlaG (beta-lactamase superfamily)
MLFRENFLKSTPYMRVSEKPRPKEWPADAITAAWIGHATVLINFRGTTILTDPALGERLAPPEVFGTNIGIRRITELPVKPEDLPPIDLVLLSHAHYDHWDLETLRRFKPPTRVVIPQGTRDLVPEGHFGEVIELAWGESARTCGLTITAMPVQHSGRRNGESQTRGYNGYLIERDSKRIFFPGDTAFTRWPAEEWLKNFGGKTVDLCLFPIGNYYFHYDHMTPEEAWELFRLLGGKQLMPIHWRTFILSPRDQEPIFEPIARLRAAAGDEAWRIVGAEPGQVVTVPDSP